MSKVAVFTSLTLDGVMQAPGGPGEDRRGGFLHGGWAGPYAHPMMWDDMGRGGALLLGRRTYEILYDYWPNQTDNPFTDVLNNIPKYVASTTLREPLPWSNSTLLAGDVPAAVGRLKEEVEKDIVILGSGELTRFLMGRGLIDEYVLLIHPLVLGSGRRLFADGGPEARLELADARTTPTGVVIATYRPDGHSPRPA